MFFQNVADFLIFLLYQLAILFHIILLRLFYDMWRELRRLKTRIR